ncbi:unnamed protein product, partial [Leptidea sinapis]
VCNFIVHERCVGLVVTPCSGVAPSLIKNPVAHCWSEPTQHKRKFCTVCRKKLDELPSLHCMKECNFGNLQPIFLPPSAVSIPRTEVPMEAIIGVHVRPPPSQRDFGCPRRSSWAAARLARLARRLLPAACSAHGGASPPYCRGTPPHPPAAHPHHPPPEHY